MSKKPTSGNTVRTGNSGKAVGTFDGGKVNTTRSHGNQPPPPPPKRTK